jgi:hypothetical protein
VGEIIAFVVNFIAMIGELLPAQMRLKPDVVVVGRKNAT